MAYYMPNVCRRLSYEFDVEDPEVADNEVDPPAHIAIDVHDDDVVISSDSEDEDYDVSIDIEADNNIEEDEQDQDLHVFDLNGLYNDIRCVLIALLIHL